MKRFPKHTADYQSWKLMHVLSELRASKKPGTTFPSYKLGRTTFYLYVLVSQGAGYRK